MTIKIVKIYLGLSLVLWAVWGQFIFRQFLGPAYIYRDIQAPSYVVSTNDRVLIYCTCHFQGGSLCFSFFRLLVSSVSDFCPDTKGAVVNTFLRLTCSVALWGGRDTANKQHWRVLAVSQPRWACCHSKHTPLRLQVAQLGNRLRLALGCVHLPSLSSSGSGTQVILRGADSVGPAFCALPRSEQLRCFASAVAATYRLSRLCCSVF